MEEEEEEKVVVVVVKKEEIGRRTITSRRHCQDAKFSNRGCVFACVWRETCW
jgi:hypothetical protein